MRDRVLAARSAAVTRWAQHGRRRNADVPGPLLRSHPGLPIGVVDPLYERVQRGHLTARAATRVLQVAWTIADLQGAERPDRDAVELAIHLRAASSAP